MILPPEFISTITKAFGADGEHFIADLPALIGEASARWGLTNIEPVPNLSFNFVAFANLTSPPTHLPASFGGASRGERDVLLKIGLPSEELASEIEALRLFNGEGACRLIDSEEGKGLLLLERLRPGVMLAEMADDDQATRIAAEVMKRIWKPLGRVTLSDSEGSPVKSERLFGRDERSLRVTEKRFIQLTAWFNELKQLRERFNGGTGPFDGRLVDRLEQETRELFAENHMPVLLHGDFHHFNILSSERGWLVIDPKGVIGPAGYEVGPLMMNPWGSFSDGINSRRRVKRRIDILHELLGFERERIIEWSLAHAILSAWWGIEDNTGWEYSMGFARLIASL